MQRTNDANTIATLSNSKLSPAFIVAAFVGGVLLSALCFALRHALASLMSSSVALPAACVLGAVAVRAIETFVSSLVRASAASKAQRNETA